MRISQRIRHINALKTIGYEDSPPLTLQSLNSQLPVGRELSWPSLVCTIVTGFTSVLLMGAALYVSFQGQDTFSTPYRALRPPSVELPENAPNSTGKGNRKRPLVQSHSAVERIEASIMENDGPREIIRNQPFVRVRATLATITTLLTENIPAYDPAAQGGEMTIANSAKEINTNIYGSEVEGEVSIRSLPFPPFVPTPSVSDQVAANFVRQSPEAAVIEPAGLALALFSPTETTGRSGQKIATEARGVAENVTVLPRTTSAQTRTERLLILREQSSLDDILRKNGFAADAVQDIAATVRSVYPAMAFIAGTKLRILFGPSRDSANLMPYRVSVYLGVAGGRDRHLVTIALTDNEKYVLAAEPPAITFPDEDTEDVAPGNLPTLYRAIWETGRKYDLSDDIIRQTIASFSSQIDLNKKIDVGDSLELLQTAPDVLGGQELLYVGLHIGAVSNEVFRFRTDDGKVGYFDPSGERGKSFLTRRPLQGGGIVRSPFGYRIHPIFRTRSLHNGVDLAAPTGTPIYAAGDGLVEMARWNSGYGNFVRLRHINGYETDYAHMSRFSAVAIPGTQVRQGQIIGYVGSTGNSTGPHLHFGIRINGNYVDPFSVKLPVAQTLTARDRKQFELRVVQIRDLMAREAIAFPKAPIK